VSAAITDDDVMALARTLDAAAIVPSRRETAATAVTYETALEMDGRGYVASLPNILKALRSASLFAIKIRRDRFLDTILLCINGEWRPFTDTDYVALREELQNRGFREVSADKMRDAVRKVAEENQFDSAQEWLASLVWDGKPRVAEFLSKYVGCKRTSYSTAVSEYLFTALAGRVLVPGIKADMAVVLVGAQGTFKTSAVKAIAPSPDHFVEIDLTAKDDDLARKMRGKLVAEIPELKGLRTRDADSIKSFISRQREEWVPKFFEFVGYYDRRLVFIGTTNDEKFLFDDTGNRRWLPIEVVGRIDVTAIVRDRDQLWAEAAEMFQSARTPDDRIRWREAEQLAKREHGHYFTHDEWEAPIQQWLAAPPLGATKSSPPKGDAPFTSYDVLTGALGLKGSQVSRATQMRLATILRRLEYEAVRTWVEGSRVRAWAKAGTVDDDDEDA
jgi:predicted P-loop ATPase